MECGLSKSNLFRKFLSIFTGDTTYSKMFCVTNIYLSKNLLKKMFMAN